MNEPPRRRRRTTYSDEPGGPKSIPFVPLFIAVILVGLALGALLSRHNANTVTNTAINNSVATVTPLATQEPTPSAVPSPSPSSSSRPKASASPAPHKTPHRIALMTTPPSAAPTPSAASTATAAPTIAATAARTMGPQPIRAVAPRVTPRPATPRPATPRPATPRPVVHTPTPAPPLTGAARAQAIATTYLTALFRADTATAAAQLGQSPGDASFPEQNYVGPTAHITSVHTTDAGGGSYKVEVEFRSSSGLFYDTITVSNGLITDRYPIRIQ